MQAAFPLALWWSRQVVLFWGAVYRPFIEVLLTLLPPLCGQLAHPSNYHSRANTSPDYVHLTFPIPPQLQQP